MNRYLPEKEKCCGCEACVQICPVGCICWISDEEGFYYPQISEERCIDCGKCERACPVISVIRKG